MWEDEIIEELHRIREKYAKSFNYDLDATFADWQEKQAKSDRKIIKLLLQRHNDTEQTDDKCHASFQND